MDVIPIDKHRGEIMEAPALVTPLTADGMGDGVL